MKTSKNDIGRAFNKAFDDYSLEPNANLWAKIEKRNIAPSTITQYLSAAKFAASMAIIIAITVVTYFILSTGINQIVEKNTAPETIVAPIFLPKQIVEEQKEIGPIFIKETETVNSQENITNKNIVEKINPPKVGNTSKQNIPLNTEEIKEDNIIIPILAIDVDVLDIEEEIIEREIKLAQQIIPEGKELIIVTKETEEAKNIVDSLKVVFGEDKVICFGEDAILEVEEGYKYNWSNGEIGNKVKVSPTENSFYGVTVSNDSGQTNIHTYTVNIDRTCSALFIPSAFTPNGDGQNDFFKAEGQGLISMKMYVYDKYGSKVFEANNIDDRWDGVYKNKQQGAGTFFYVAEYVDAKGNSHIKKGQVIIIR